MSRSRHILRTLFEMNLKEFGRDFSSVFFSFVFPCFFVLVLTLQSCMAPRFTYELGIVSEGDSAGTARLISLVTSSRSIQARTVSMEEGNRALKDGKLHALLVVPKGDLTSGGSTLRLIADPRFAELGKLALNSARAQIVQEKQGFSQPFKYRVEPPAVKSLSDFSFIFPGMLALALLQLGLFATATPLLRARDRGTLRHLSLTPLRPFDLITSQVSLRLLISLTQLALLLGVGAMNLSITGNQWILLLGVALLGTTMLIAVGYAIAGAAPTPEAGMTMVMVANFAMLFGGNVFWDPSKSPVLKAVAYALPLTYLSDMFRQTISGVTGLLPLWSDALIVLAWAAAAMMVAMKTFRFDMEKH